MANPSYTYTLTNGTTADADQVMQNFSDILAGVSDGTKDLSISALTAAGTATLNGNVNIGNSSSDDLTITASLASTLPIKTTNTYDIGSATKGLAGVYFGTADTDTARVVSAALAASRTYTLPDAGAAADFVMTAGSQTIAGVKTFSGQGIIKGTAAADDATTGYIGEIQRQTRLVTSAVSLTTATAANMTATALTLTAGDWDVWGAVGFNADTSTSITTLALSISTTSATLSADSTTAVPNSSGEYKKVFLRAAFVPGNGNVDVLETPRYRVTVATSRTLYLVGYAVFTVSSLAAWGCIEARRAR